MALTRTGFKRKSYERTPMAAPRPVRQVAATRILDVVLASPKEAPVRSEAYRRLVAQLACKVCGIAGYSQAAHPNTGKGAGIKTDDRLCFALCTIHPGVNGNLVQGCHECFDQGALFSKPVRRALEPAWAADTRRRITAAGQWPASLPAWDGDL